MDKGTPQSIATAGLRTSFVRVADSSFAGYAFDPTDPTRRYAIELFVDGLPLKLARADAYVDELAREGFGDGCYGFSFMLPPAALAEISMLEARLANEGAPVGVPVALGLGEPKASDVQSEGSVRWLGGLRFSGWCLAKPGSVPRVTALIDGEPVAAAAATSWMNVGALENVTAVRAFDLHLPERLADGRVRRARFVTETGQDIPPSPLAFVAFADGLQRSLKQLGGLESERLRGELFDRLVPMSLPFSAYQNWRERFSVTVAPSQAPPFALVLIGPGDQETSLATIKDQQYGDWVVATLPEAEGQLDFGPELLREFLVGEAQDCALVLFALAGTQLTPDALQRLADAFTAFPDAAAAYGDVGIIEAPAASPGHRKKPRKPLPEPGGNVWPLALSAFDYERLLEQGYCAHLFALRRSQVEAALEAGASDLYRLFNATLDRSKDAVIIHLPGVLGALPKIDTTAASRALTQATAAHLKARGVAAKISLQIGTVFPAVKVARRGARASITVIIPVRNKPALLRACLDSIDPAIRSERAEIIVIDNDSSDPEMLHLLEELKKQRALVLPVPGSFNFARLNNIAVEKAHTEFLCFLNNDIKALDASWLRELAERITEPDVGAVGAKLLWPSGVVQHGGVVLGTNFAATHAFNDRIDKDPGYGDLLRVAHECSAVTAACLLTRRSDYLAVGGMDEIHFPVNFNDVDYCLKLRAAGKRIVFTPHARLLHFESASRGTDALPDRAARFERELRVLRDRWGEVFLSDPYYSPMLSLDPIPFSALAWPPRDMSPRINERPIPRGVPPGF